MPSFDFVVEVIVKVLQIGVVENFDMLFDSLSQQLLASFAHSQEIRHKNSFEIFKQTVHMLLKGLVGEFKATVDFRFGVETNLLEEHWQAASDLNIAEAKLVDLNNLLSLAVISNVALIVDTPIEVPSTSFDRGASSDQAVFELGPLVENLKAADETLNNRSLPVLWGFLTVELVEELFVPDKGSCDLGGLLLAVREGHSVLMREVKSML